MLCESNDGIGLYLNSRFLPGEQYVINSVFCGRKAYNLLVLLLLIVTYTNKADKNVMVHFGTGRIARLTMRPMSLLNL